MQNHAKASFQQTRFDAQDSDKGSVEQSGHTAIHLRGARQHNLQGIDLDFQLGKLTVICGVSGSGKTSLALNTLYAEGQRRYIESFSAYTRQFLQRIDKPLFDSLTNLPPSIAVTREQRSRNNRSTVGTASEMLEYLRVLFAKESSLNCYSCNRRIESHNPKSILAVLQQSTPRRAMVCFEIGWNSKTELSEILFDLQSSGFIRLILQDHTIHLGNDDRTRVAERFLENGKALVVVDRLILGPNLELDRTTQSVAAALEHLDPSGNRSAVVLMESESDNQTGLPTERRTIDDVEFTVERFSASLRCEHCAIEFPPSEPRLFNFNSPIGACGTCEGFGEVVAIDMEKVVPNKSLSLNEGAIAAWRTPAYAHELEELKEIAVGLGIPMDEPVSRLKTKHWRLIQEGVPEKKFGGLHGFFAWLERKKYKMHVRAFLARWRTYSTCTNCRGARLNQGALAYRTHGKTFAELCDLTIDELGTLLSGDNAVEHRSPDEPTMQAAETRKRYLASEPNRQVRNRIEYLQSVGLGYLSLARPLHTLSSGEAQRVSMTTLLGSSLVNMLYVFDEPTVGLHPQDTERMAAAILGLRDRGNTVVLVEHEPYLMKIADQIVEIGPLAGEQGGRVTFQGTPQELAASDCATGEYLSGKRSIQRSHRTIGNRWLELRGASGRNLQVELLRVPIGCLTMMIGPSGSGKSSLVLDTLCPAIAAAFGDETDPPLPLKSIAGTEHIVGCLAIDQSPIQRSLRSSPVTYCKAMDELRHIFAETPEAKARRFGIGHFSFNSEIGCCPTCEGLGFTTVDMQFMADVQLPCTDCEGKRFRPEVLEIRFRDLSISEVLAMSVDRAHTFFRGQGKVQERLKPLIDIGLGYLPLGQSLSTLSAGESMRLKLASQLDHGGGRTTVNHAKGKLIVLDEPTTGLHFSDVERLLRCLDALIDEGNSVLVIEHNQQMIESADHVIELGPGAGPLGGRIL